jgi:hypothetical protein
MVKIGNRFIILETTNPEKGLTKTEARKIRNRQFAAQRKAAGLDCN